MVTESLIEKLLPCPFCPDGGDPYVNAIGNDHSRKRGDGAEVGGKKCYFSKKVGVVRYSVEWAVNAAIEAWNTRVTPAAQPATLTDDDKREIVDLMVRRAVAMGDISLVRNMGNALSAILSDPRFELRRRG